MRAQRCGSFHESGETVAEYSGGENLEVMEEAVNYNRFLLSLIRSHASREQKILDFGAGIGTFASALAKEGYSIRCVEADERQAQSIAAKGIPVARSLDAISNESVDYVYTLNVLEHIEDDSAILRDCQRKLVPGGNILIYVPAFQVLYSSMDKKVGHFRRYTIGDLSRKVCQAGFRVKEASYVDSLGFFASLLFKFAGNNSGDLNRKALIAYDRLLFPVSRMIDAAFKRTFGKNVLVVAARED